MDGEPLHTDARERVLLAAERLFTQRGYAAVTLRDIAAEVGIRHASLYHHVPGGKEELFIEVTERSFARHHQGIRDAITGAAPNLRARLYAIAGWLLSQPPMDVLRMVYSDLPSLDQRHAERLSTLVFTTLILPATHVLADAQRQGEIGEHNTILLAGSIVNMVEGLHAVPQQAIEPSLEMMAHQVIDALLDGIHIPPSGYGNAAGTSESSI